MLLVHKGVPYGYGELKWQYGSWWVVSVMAGRESKVGTGREILRKLIAEARKKDIPDLRMGTHYDNLSMLYCALHCGFELLGTDEDGYVLEKRI